MKCSPLIVSTSLFLVVASIQADPLPVPNFSFEDPTDPEPGVTN